MRSQIVFTSGLGSDAPPLLLKAAKRLERFDLQLARETYLTAWGAAIFAGQGDVIADVSRAVLALAPPDAPRPIDLVLDGFLMTIALSALGLCLALVIGVLFGTAGSSPRRALRTCAAAYVEVVRNIPLLVHMYFWYVGLAFLQLPPFACAVAALTLYSGAYVAETVRSGLGAVPRGQGLAALAAGLTPR